MDQIAIPDQNPCANTPNATVASGYQPDVMPATYGDTLSDEQLDALVQYLVDGQKGGE